MIASIRERINNWHLTYKLLLLATLLNITDYQTTHILVSATNYSVEFNPFLRALMEYFDSTTPIIVVKAILIGFVWWLILHFEGHPRCNLDRIVNPAGTLAAIFAGITAWNYHLIYVHLWS